jgi:hypothetical protein
MTYVLPSCCTKITKIPKNYLSIKKKVELAIRVQASYQVWTRRGQLISLQVNAMCNLPAAAV